MPEGAPVAQFRNVSGVDLDLSLPQWFDKRPVDAGDVIDVDDDLVAAHPEDKPRNYFSPVIWEQIVTAPKSANKNTDGE
jgi:hypothetical protein